MVRVLFFFFNDTATTEIYTLSLHDALPISRRRDPQEGAPLPARVRHRRAADRDPAGGRGDAVHARARGARGGHDRRHRRSEEHTSELQSRQYLVCRLLLEKKKKNATTTYTS